MARAVIVFISRVLPCMPPQFTSRELWNRGFSLTYAAELRAERQEKLAGLFDTAPERYEALTRTAMGLAPFSMDATETGQGTWYRTKIPKLARLSSRIAWRARCCQGKLLSILRLLKGIFTFEGGLDYILWKIERHSGIQVELNPQQKRIPLVGVMVLFWRLYRRGAFR